VRAPGFYDFLRVVLRFIFIGDVILPGSRAENYEGSARKKSARGNGKITGPARFMQFPWKLFGAISGTADCDNIRIEISSASRAANYRSRPDSLACDDYYCYCYYYCVLIRRVVGEIRCGVVSLSNSCRK